MEKDLNNKHFICPECESKLIPHFISLKLTCTECNFSCTYLKWVASYKEMMYNRVISKDFYKNYSLKVTYYIDSNGKKVPTIGAVASYEPVIAMMTQEEFHNGGKERLEKELSINNTNNYYIEQSKLNYIKEQKWLCIVK